MATVINYSDNVSQTMLHLQYKASQHSLSDISSGNMSRGLRHISGSDCGSDAGGRDYDWQRPLANNFPAALQTYPMKNYQKLNSNSNTTNVHRQALGDPRSRLNTIAGSVPSKPQATQIYSVGPDTDGDDMFPNTNITSSHSLTRYPLYGTGNGSVLASNHAANKLDVNTVEFDHAKELLTTKMNKALSSMKDDCSNYAFAFCDFHQLLSNLLESTYSHDWALEFLFNFLLLDRNTDFQSAQHRAFDDMGKVLNDILDNKAELRSTWSYQLFHDICVPLFEVVRYGQPEIRVLSAEFIYEIISKVDISMSEIQYLIRLRTSCGDSYYDESGAEFRESRDSLIRLIYDRLQIMEIRDTELMKLCMSEYGIICSTPTKAPTGRSGASPNAPKSGSSEGIGSNGGSGGSFLRYEGDTVYYRGPWGMFAVCKAAYKAGIAGKKLVIENSYERGSTSERNDNHSPSRMDTNKPHSRRRTPEFHSGVRSLISRLHENHGTIRLKRRQQYCEPEFNTIPADHRF